jgi:hypothetical protein
MAKSLLAQQLVAPWALSRDVPPHAFNLVILSPLRSSVRPVNADFRKLDLGQGGQVAGSTWGLYTLAGVRQGGNVGKVPTSRLLPPDMLSVGLQPLLM